MKLLAREMATSEILRIIACLLTNPHHLTPIKTYHARLFLDNR